MELLVFLHSYHMRYGKNIGDKIVHFKKKYKFTSDHFSIEHVVFVLIVENVTKNPILHQIYAGYKKNVVKQNCLFQIDVKMS